MIEDAALSLYGTMYGTTGARAPTFGERCLGAVWVCVWMAWTAPSYMYPVLAKTNSGEAGVVPFSVIKYVTGQVTA